jgi:hypothetical protein
MRHFLDESPRFLLADPKSKSAANADQLSPLPDKIRGHA